MECGKKKSPFLEEVRQVMRVQHYAIRTEQAYMECMRLRVKDIDLDRLSVTVRSGKGGKGCGHSHGSGTIGT